MASYVRAQVGDLNELTRDLEAVQLGLGREVAAVKREGAGILAGRASRFSEVAPGRISGDLSRSIRPRGATVITTVPQGPVHAFGGRIAPRGTPFRIARSAFHTKAAAREMPRLERKLGQRIEALIARHL